MDTNGTFCRMCGTKLEIRELENEGMIPYCPKCEAFRFPQYNVAVSMITVNEATDEILLIQQYGRPSYVLVAGYVSKGEALEDAVRREVREETGMTVDHMKFNRSQYFEKSDTLMCNFTAYVKSADEMHANYEIDSYKWFSCEEAAKNIRPGSLAEHFLVSYLGEPDVGARVFEEPGKWEPAAMSDAPTVKEAYAASAAVKEVAESIAEAVKDVADSAMAAVKDAPGEVK